MNRTSVTAALAWLVFGVAGGRAADVELRSPDGRVAVAVTVAEGMRGPTYRVRFAGREVVGASPLGLTFGDGGAMSDVEVVEAARASVDQTYPIVAGKAATARDHYNEVMLSLTEKGGLRRKVEVSFRAYDDGVAYRYRIPEQPAIRAFELVSEESGFALPGGATAWVMAMPGVGGHYEYPYGRMKVSEMKDGEVVGMPLLVELPDGGPAVAITEANLLDYAGMALVPSGEASDGGDRVLRGALTPLPGQKEVKVRGTAPHTSPWRVMMVGESAGKLIESNLVSNLSEPCRIEDTSWIRPGKVAFLWWNGYLVGRNGKRGGVDTATFKHYVDGAAELAFPYSSIDGLDVAWYGGRIPGYGEHDITVPVKGLDIQEVLAHAKAKGVRIRLWVASQGMRKYLDKALATYEQWGVEGVMVDFIERDDQETVNWIRELVEKAAKHRLTVTLHNVPKPTGLARTYPNLLGREAVRNQEWNKWDKVGVTPEHNVTVPFTRMLAGPMDYHSGGFRSIRTADYRPRDVAPDVMGTRCHQLAMYVVYENPMPMAVDYPAAYRGSAGVEFLSAVPTTWDETRFVDGKVGDYVVVARRKGSEWYVGCMTDDTAREVKVPLPFLGNGEFEAETWADDVESGPNALVKATAAVRSGETLTAKLGPAGGQVIRLRPISDQRP